MPKYTEFERDYFEEMKKKELHWSYFLNPEYSKEVTSKKEFDSHIESGHHQIVKEDQREFIRKYMYHHDLRYSSIWLRIKDNRFNIMMGLIQCILLGILFTVIIASSKEPGHPFKMNQSPIDIITGAFMVVGLTLGGTNLAIGGYSLSKLFALLALVFGGFIILSRNEIATVIYPYIQSNPVLLIVFPVGMLIAFYLNLFKKKI